MLLISRKKPKEFQEIHLAWDKALKLTQLSSNKWLFRGQPNAEWRLKTTLEKAFEDFGIPLCEAEKTEEKLLREFKRRLHHFTTNIPDDNDTCEWLALMRHYGAPTRLLDFTYSFYVAAFFAAESSTPENDMAIWAIRDEWMTQEVDSLLREKDSKRHCAFERRKNEGKDQIPETFDQLFRSESPDSADNPVQFIWSVNPFRLNERLVLQQGLFLCQSNLSKSFEDNLKSLRGFDDKRNLIKIVLHTKERKDVLKQLHRMNMHRATLFPGLDGFAQSLRTRILSLSI